MSNTQRLLSPRRRYAALCLTRALSSLALLALSAVGVFAGLTVGVADFYKK